MAKRVMVLVVAFMLFFQGAAFALNGEVVFKDALYGAAVGGLIGAGLYAMDSEDAGTKIGGGVVAGAVVGILIGVAETSSLVEIRDHRFALGIPSPSVEVKGDETIYRANLLRAAF